jgi:hypothetical protein
MRVRAQIGKGPQSGQMHRLPHLFGHLQKRMDVASWRGICVVQQRRNQAWHWLSERLGKSGNAGMAAGRARKTASCNPNKVVNGAALANIFANPNLPSIDDYYEPFTFDYEHLQKSPESKTMPTAQPVSVITGKKMDKIVGGPNWEEILAVNLSIAARITISRTCRKKCTASSKTPS